MTWVRLDDQFPINRKVGALPDTAFRLHVEAICWCARNRTDGVVSREDLPQVTRIGKPARLVTMLVQRGLWHPAGHACPSPTCPQSPVDNGWVIHDYLAYNPSKTQAEREREQNAERQRRWREQRKSESNAVSNAVSHGVTNGAPTRPDPTPRGGTSLTSTTDRARTDPEPPLRCPRHQDNPNPPSCGDCADHRRQHESWTRRDAERRRRAPRCRVRGHEHELAANCRLCAGEARAGWNGATGQYAAIPRPGAAA